MGLFYSMTPEEKSKQVFEELYSQISSDLVRIFPHMKTMPQGRDPWEVSIEDHDDGEEKITTASGYVEAFVVDFGENIGLRARFRPVIIDCDADDKEFSNVREASRYFIETNLRLKLRFDPEPKQKKKLEPWGKYCDNDTGADIPYTRMW